jgi:hypothetical protein
MYCIVVKRADFQGYDILHRAFGQKVSVIWERRHGARRQHVEPSQNGERRRAERRGPPPASWTALGFVVVPSDR